MAQQRTSNALLTALFCIWFFGTLLRFISGFLWSPVNKPSSYHDRIFHANASSLTFPPFHPEILQAEGAISKWSDIAPIWSLTMTFAWFVAATPLGLGVSGFELYMSIRMSKSLHLVAPFIPHSYGACNNAETWQVTNGTESLFGAFSRMNATGPEPKSICESWVREYRYGIGHCVILALTSIAMFIPTFTIWAPVFLHMNRVEYRDLFICYIRIFTFFIPGFIKYRVELVLRFLAKLCQEIRIKLPSIRKNPDNFELKRLRSQFKFQGPPTPNILTKYLYFDIFALISKDLHYGDIINLSRSSRGLHAMIFPEGDNDAFFNRLAQYTCRNRTKTVCWLCNMQICKRCCKTLPQDLSPTEFHVTCKTYCTTCYFRTHLRKRHRFQSSCNCADSEMSHTPAANGNSSSQTWWVCEACYGADPLDQTAGMERRRVLVRKKLRELKESCSGCQKRLGGFGPSWWACGKCEFECKSRYHPQWRWGKAKKKEGEEEDEEIVDAVV